ncbi:MAG TPA: DUF2970 domain-containing protein [Burkholderiaceae bacterium]|nr:DUF2970 domain-containing protein [Burkholderiaceae bacterium]
MTGDLHHREQDRPGADLKAAVRRKGSFLQSMKAVAWSFFGVRKASEYDKDVSQLNPVHVIIAGIVAAVLFVAGLVLLVRWVIGSGVAA